MKTIKLLSLGILFLSSVTFGSSFLKDAQLQIPFSNFTLEPYAQLTAYIPHNSHLGANIVCLIKSAIDSHPSLQLSLTSSNLYVDPSSSPDDIYNIVGSQTIYIYKNNIKSYYNNYGSYIRFNNYATTGQVNINITCQYS